VEADSLLIYHFGVREESTGHKRELFLQLKIKDFVVLAMPLQHWLTLSLPISSGEKS
jgi:hypothetical protein